MVSCSQTFMWQQIIFKRIDRFRNQSNLRLRVTNLRAIRSLDKNIEIVYIKPPAKRSIKSIVKLADVSFNTEYDTIKMLSEAAGELNKIHKVVIMIELGELREGVLREIGRASCRKREDKKMEA